MQSHFKQELFEGLYFPQSQLALHFARAKERENHPTIIRFDDFVAFLDSLAGATFCLISHVTYS